MKEFIKEIKLSFILAALLYLALGVVLLLWPIASSTIICYIFGTLLLVYGAISIISFFAHSGGGHHFKLELLLGIVAAGLGLFFLIRPAMVLSVLPVILGVYIAVDSLVNLKRAIELFRLNYSKWWVALLLSLIGVGLGVFTLAYRFVVASTLIMVVGVVFIYMGLADLWSLYKVTRLTKELRKRAPIEVDPIDIE